MLLVFIVSISVLFRLTVFLFDFLFITLLLLSLLLVSRSVCDLDDCEDEDRDGLEPMIGVYFLLEVEQHRLEDEHAVEEALAVHEFELGGECVERVLIEREGREVEVLEEKLEEQRSG